jgi:hypothetical protein
LFHSLRRSYLDSIVESEILTVTKTVLAPDTMAPHLAAFPPGARERLAAALSTPSFDGKLEGPVVDSLGMKIPEVMSRLLPLARLYALADYRVGAITQGATGAFYFGANL